MYRNVSIKSVPDDGLVLVGVCPLRVQPKISSCDDDPRPYPILLDESDRTGVCRCLRQCR